LLWVSEDGRAEFLALMAAVIAATRDEPGAEQLALHELVEEPGTFLVYGRYQSLAALDVHEEQPSLKALFERLGELLVEPSTSTDLRAVDFV
jgi:quinol monooxygenase YgiN